MDQWIVKNPNQSLFAVWWTHDLIDNTRCPWINDTFTERWGWTRPFNVHDLNATASYVIGEACYRWGGYEEAIKKFSRSIQLDPKSRLAYYARGLAYNNLAYNRSGNDKDGYRKAIYDFDEAMELYNKQPDNISAILDANLNIEDIIAARQRAFSQVAQ